MRLLLAPFLVAAWLWRWAAPAIPDPGLRYVTLFILPQVLIQQGGGWLLQGMASSANAWAGCLTVFCCCCLPLLFVYPGRSDDEEPDLIPEFGSRRKPPTR